MSTGAPTPAPEAPWPPPWARTIGFFAGLALMGFEAVVDHSAHLVLYGPAFALTGLPLARGLESLIDVMKGKLPPPAPPPAPPPPTAPPQRRKRRS